MYSISFEEVAITLAQDLFELAVPADACMILHSVTVSQSSDAGDAQSEQLPFAIKRMTPTVTSGSGGSSSTPVKLETGDAAAGITAEVNNTTRATTSGTTTTLWAEDVNVMAGLNYVPTPETRPIFSPSEYCIIGLEAAPGDSITTSGVVIVEELGG